MKWLSFLLIMIPFLVSAQKTDLVSRAVTIAASTMAPTVVPTPVPTVREVKLALDSLLFVRRFTSVETPCVVINPDEPGKATVYPDMRNSNYRTKQLNTGVLCLSQYCAQYLRLSHGLFVDSSQSVTGDVELTYAYPASSIIQYLGITYDKSGSDRSQWFFNYFLRSLGSYSLQVKNGRYEITIVLNTSPYTPLDTIYGYLELVRSVDPVNTTKVYEFFFEHMKMYKGDDVQIFQKYATATFDSEAMFYTNMLTNTLMDLNNVNGSAHRNALWVSHFYSSPHCPSCGFVYAPAFYSATHPHFALPDVNPYPAH